MIRMKRVAGHEATVFNCYNSSSTSYPTCGPVKTPVQIQIVMNKIVYVACRVMPSL